MTSNDNPDWVLAYQVVRVNEDGRECAYYCVTVGGEIYTTGYRPYTREVMDNFKVKGDTWTVIEECPYEAEFIGRYIIPAQISRGSN